MLFFDRARHHRDLRSFPTRRSSDLVPRSAQSVSTASRRSAPERSASERSTRSIRQPRSEASARRASASEQPSTVNVRSEEHTSELQSRRDLVCRLLLEKKKKTQQKT